MSAQGDATPEAVREAESRADAAGFPLSCEAGVGALLSAPSLHSVELAFCSGVLLSVRRR